jgi:hypothetical protein
LRVPARALVNLTPSGLLMFNQLAACSDGMFQSNNGVQSQLN